MPMVEITVNGRRHSVQCGEGEEARVRGLASYVDRKVAELLDASVEAIESLLARGRRTLKARLAGRWQALLPERDG